MEARKPEIMKVGASVGDLPAGSGRGYLDRSARRDYGNKKGVLACAEDALGLRFWASW